MSYSIRNGRGKAKASDFVKTDEDARKVVRAAMRRDAPVELSTGTFVIKTTRPQLLVSSEASSFSSRNP